MPVCRFWGKGTCKNGSNCRFDHIGPPGQEVSGGGGFNRNPFNSVGSSGNQAYGGQTTFGGKPSQGQGSFGRTQDNRSGRVPTGPQPGQQAQLPYLLSKDGMITDLSTELPQWILSAYGPGLKAPVQLFGGEEREKSFEEMRLNHYAFRAQGQEALAVHQQDELIQKAAAQNQNALNNINDALQYVLNGEHEHPNRLDIVEQYTRGIISPTQSAPTLGQVGSSPSLSTVNALGQPTQNPPNSLGGQSVFGAPSQTFQQPGLISSPLASQPFGTQPLIQPAQPAQPVSTSPFGQQPHPTGLGAFGQATSFQQTPQNPLGAQSQSVQAPNSFGQAQPQTHSVFGLQQSQQPAQQSPFGQAVGQQIQGFSSGASPLSTTTATNGQQNGPPPFGPSAASNSQTANPFAPVIQQQAPQGPQFANFTSSGMAADPSPYPPNSNAQHPHPSTYTSRDSSNRITMFNGKPVTYRDGHPVLQNPDGSWEKIWFPNGPPGYYNATELPEHDYDQATKDAYEKFRQTGEWEGGKLPLLPPRREWSKWDF